MNTKKQLNGYALISSTVAFALIAGLAWVSVSGQVRSGRQGTAAKGDNASAATNRQGGAAVKGDNASAATTRQGGAAVKGDNASAVTGRHGNTVVKGDEGYAAVGRNGATATVQGDIDVDNVSVGRHGAVVAGEEGVAAVGRHGSVVVGNRYEDYEAWRAIAGVTAAIAVGTMLARPPTAATTVVVAGTTYWVHENTYYARVMNGGEVAYQVVAPPR